MKLKSTLRILSIVSVMLATLLPASASGPSPIYRVQLPAETREERSALAAAGYDIESVGPGWVTVLMTGPELSRFTASAALAPTAQPVDFPPRDLAYHNYAEVQGVLAAVAAAHSNITHLGSLGLSPEGRDIPYIKISDAPHLQQLDEPAVFFMALTHGREHLTVEMALAIVETFTDGYGEDAAITGLVNEREIYVVPIANPDGGEYDIESGVYRYWRKNRRHTGGDNYGVDLNRNYGYRWGGEGSSGNPVSDTYRGPAAFSEPETQAIRDFVIAHPNITAAISFHTYGEWILYPYGYTYEDLPADMKPEDLLTLKTMAQAMAATNGYTVQQASDLYITSGDTTDWLYGELGVFAFTFEMYPKWGDPGFYPPASDIQSETQRNLPAVLYLTDAAGQTPRIEWQRTYAPFVAK
jgi:carboxypeptidase T